MRSIIENESELFMTKMRWLVILGSPLLFYLTDLPMNNIFWTVVGTTALLNLFLHIHLLFKPFNRTYAHFLSVMDTIFVSTLLLLRGEQQTDLHQLYYFLILVLGIRYGIKKYLGLVFIISIIYIAVSYGGAAFYDAVIDKVQIITQLIYYFAFAILTSFILGREYQQRLEKEELLNELQAAYRQLCIYNAQVEEMAIRDPLTGIYNYRYFSERLNIELEWSKKYRKPLAVILVDIDYFKSFNDTYGHPAGDIALKEVSRVFTDNIRDNDIVARYGGEEFLILLPDTEIEEAYQCAQRIRKAVEAMQIKIEQLEAPVNITVSAGVSALSLQANSPEEIIENADKALYFAKRKGRNMVKVADDIERSWSNF